MKKFGLKLFLFFTFAFLVYCGFVILVGELGNPKFKKNLNYVKGQRGHTYSRLRDAEKAKNPDLLIFGTSLAFKGFDTRIFEANGIDAFNLGTAGETPLQTEFMIRRYLKKIDPEYVIYEVNAEWFATNRIESALDIISNLPYIDWETVKMAARINKVRVYNNLIYSFYKAHLAPDDGFVEPVRNNDELYIPGGGYVETKIIHNYPVEIGTRKLYFSEKQKRAFERSLDYMDDLGVEYILIMSPITNHHYNAFENAAEIDQYYSSKGTYMNFNYIEELDDSLHFGDSRHLNQNGVIIFDKEVIKYLKDDLGLFKEK
jgi:hypothetical protein